MRTAPALLITSLLLLGLAACAPDEEPVERDPSPSATPIFASDEEALAAAEEAYGAYLEVVDTIHADGGEGSERLGDVAEDPVLSDEIKGFESFSERGHHTVGYTSFDSFSLQSFEANSAESTVLAYACEDFSTIDVQDGNGISVVSPERQLRWPLVIGFDYVEDHLEVSSVEDWSGDDFCVSPSS